MMNEFENARRSQESFDSLPMWKQDCILERRRNRELGIRRVMTAAPAPVLITQTPAPKRTPKKKCDPNRKFRKQLMQLIENTPGEILFTIPPPSWKAKAKKEDLFRQVRETKNKCTLKRINRMVRTARELRLPAWRAEQVADVAA